MDPHEIVEEALAAVSKLRVVIAKQSGKQITAAEPRTLAKATALTWLKRQRPVLNGLSQLPRLIQLDGEYRTLLDATERATSKARYSAMITSLKGGLVAIRADAVRLASELANASHGDPPPNFSKLVPDAAMQAVLRRRWEEAQLCMSVGAHLAAAVMMGSLLEALLLARVNSLADKSSVFKAATAPKDRFGKTLPLREWTLRDYIDVGHELGWVRRAARDVGAVLRDYRNYVHPAKEFAHSVSLDASDTQMLWAVCRELARQVL